MTDDRPPFDSVWLDDRHVLLRFFDRAEQIDIRTGAHEAVPSGGERLRDSERWRSAYEDPADCGMAVGVIELGDGLGGGLEVLRPGEPPRQVVTVANARPPHPHRSGDDISAASFTRDCRYITFGFHGGLWVAELASGRSGPILPGPNLTFERWYPIGLR